MGHLDDKKLDALAALPSLGKTSAQLLIEAGVPDVETLRALGIATCYRCLRFQHGKRITLNFMYALECAVLGIDWRLLGADRKAQLAAEARRINDELAATGRKRLPVRQSRSGSAR